MKLLKITRQELIILSSLFFISFILRFYKLSDYLFFGYEQGRDAFAAKGISTFTHFVLVGPASSMGGVFHGAFYYYLLAIPYGLGHGNPFGASLFIVLISCSVSLIFYFLFKEMFSSKLLGFFGGLIVAISYQYISISRWLSNVTPSIIFVSFAFYFLWRYHKSKKAQDFLISVFLSAFASQFEINFIAQFLIVYILLFSLRIIEFPKLKTWIMSLVIVFIIFSPLILFDFRNQHISSKTVLSFLTSTKGKEDYNFLLGVNYYKSQFFNLVLRSLVHLRIASLNTLFYFCLIPGILLAFKKYRIPVLFFICWSLMPLPALLMGAPLPHLYVAAGLGVIGLFVCSLYAIYTDKSFKKLLFFLIPILVLNLSFNIQKLENNKDVFFTTIQEGMNIVDQRKLIDYVHISAKGEPYYFEAFTIPYLEQQGWLYLQQYYYPNENKPKSQLVFIAIEKQVDPYWEGRWIGDLGHSNLISERNFGLLRLQTRRRYE